jgi:hypothetical protein
VETLSDGRVGYTCFVCGTFIGGYAATVCPNCEIAAQARRTADAMEEANRNARYSRPSGGYSYSEPVVPATTAERILARMFGFGAGLACFYFALQINLLFAIPLTIFGLGFLLVSIIR